MALWLALALGGGWMWANGEVRAFENAAARDIHSKLEGLSRKVTVRAQIGDPVRASRGDLRRVTINASTFRTDGLPLFTEPERSTRGRVAELRLDLRDLTLRGLRVERLTATIPECRYDFGLARREKRVRLSRSGVGQGEVKLLAPDLERFLIAKFREFERVSVTFASNRVVVKGRGTFLVVTTDFEVNARLGIKDGVQLLLEDAQIQFDGQPVDDFVGDELLRTLNPVLDLDVDLGLSGAMNLDSLAVEGQALVGRGRATIPVKPPS